MSSDPKHDAPGSDPKPSKPVVKKMRWPFPVIWIVPMAAAVLAGYYIHEHHQENGAQITIQFDDAAGIKPNDTTISLRGVTIGHVKSVELTSDHAHTLVHVQLETSAESIARADSLFWLVRPEVSLQNITGLNTIVSGPYIDCRPGNGEPAKSFIGLTSAPKILGAGKKIILSADQISQLTVDSPVNYRGIQVGIVKDIRLSSNADSVNVTVFIWQRYETLVRTNSVFWMIKGADLQGSLLGGLKLQLGSVQNILTGGVAFATPDKSTGDRATEGTVFPLHDQPKDDWLKWKAQINLPSGEPSDGEQKSPDDDKKQLGGVTKQQ